MVRTAGITGTAVVGVLFMCQIDWLWGDVWESCPGLRSVCTSPLHLFLEGVSCMSH